MNKNTISPLEINFAMKSIFVVKRDLINSHLSDSIEMAEIQEIKLRDIYNDAENGKIVINRNMKDETGFPYAYGGIYRNEESAKIGASEVNRSEKHKVDKAVKELQEAVAKLEKVKDSFSELEKVGLI